MTVSLVAAPAFACSKCHHLERVRHSRCSGCGQWHTLVPVSELAPGASSTFDADPAARVVGIIDVAKAHPDPSTIGSVGLEVLRDQRSGRAGDSQTRTREASRPDARALPIVPFHGRELAPSPVERVARGVSTPTRITEIEAAAHFRYTTGIPGLDRVFGLEPIPPDGGALAGCVRGGIYLLSGSPGAGKSTLLMQMISRIAGDALVLYASGEEAAAQIAARAHRVDAARPNILLVAETDLEAILAHARALRPRILIVDSISTISTAYESGIPGSVTQVKACAAEIERYAHDAEYPTTVFMIGHVTQDGKTGGPRALQHLVDVLLELDGSDLRVLTSPKNRFGSTLERAAFRMTAAGLVEVDEGEIAAEEAERDARFLPIAQELLNRYLALGGHLDDGLRQRIDDRLDLEMWHETR